MPELGIGTGPNFIALGSKLNPFKDAVQYFFKTNTVISSNSGTKIFDNSSTPVNADVFQPCLYSTVDYQHFLNENIELNWVGDGVKMEVVASLKVGATQSYISCITYAANYGIIIRNIEIRIIVRNTDNTANVDIHFSTITTASDDVWYRYRIRRSGNNLICEKTLPADTSFSNVIVSETKDISSYALTTSIFDSIRPFGGLAYLNLAGYKFTFSEGALSHYSYSYNSNRSFWLAVLTERSGFQNVYCHNAIYGYTRAYIEHSSYKDYVNISYGEDELPSCSNHSAWFTKSTFIEFPANKSFGVGYGIKLSQTMLTNDVVNTFFDGSNNPILKFKNTIPSKLNNKIFFDHANNKDLLLFTSDKNYKRPINTANKSCLIVGDSMASDSYYWPIILTELSGLVRTTKSFSGRTLSTNIFGDLYSQVLDNQTLISDKDYIIVCGGFNDYAQGISESTFQSGFLELINYIRSENANAKIFICSPYNWGNPIDDGNTANAGGMTRNEMREIMRSIATSEVNSYSMNWNEANIVQSDISDNLHISSIGGGYRIAKVMYDEILQIF